MSSFSKLEERVATLEREAFNHQCIESYYVDLIREMAEVFARKAVEEMLKNPIEMTLDDIEKAFNHKIKIVGGKTNGK